MPGMGEFKEGDRILFNDRKMPLEVEDVDENRLHVKGPKGGEYVIFPAENDPDLILVANKGSREYASRVEDLRKTGRWIQEEENIWIHSRSGQKIELAETETGFWTVKTELEFEPPKYGYASREDAEQDVEKLMEENPEG